MGFQFVYPFTILGHIRFPLDVRLAHCIKSGRVEAKISARCHFIIRKPKVS